MSSYFDLSAPHSQPSISPTISISPSVNHLEWGSPTRSPVVVLNKFPSLNNNENNEFVAAGVESNGIGNLESSDDEESPITWMMVGVMVAILVGIVLSAMLFSMHKSRKKQMRDNNDAKRSQCNDNDRDIEIHETDSVEISPSQSHTWFYKIKKVLPKRKTIEQSEVSEVSFALSMATTEDKDINIVAEFCSGQRLGKDLSNWSKKNMYLLPSIESITLGILDYHKYDILKGDCTWVHPSKFGKALSEMTLSRVDRQVEILWAVQEYCSNLHFPYVKIKGVNGLTDYDIFLIDHIFKNLYEYSLVSSRAFFIWLNDNTSRKEGKASAVAQTLDWFQWLSENDP